MPATPRTNQQAWEVVLLRTDDGMHLQPSSLRPVIASLNCKVGDLRDEKFKPMDGRPLSSSRVPV